MGSFSIPRAGWPMTINYISMLISPKIPTCCSPVPEQPRCIVVPQMHTRVWKLRWVLMLVWNGYHRRPYFLMVRIGISSRGSSWMQKASG